MANGWRPNSLRNLAARIAASSHWDLADYRFEINSAQAQGTGHNGCESSSRDSPVDICFDNGETSLDNPCLAAIRDALRNFCADDHQQLRVGPVRSPAELEDLWAIDSAAYGEASITYEKFQDWWSSFPLGLAGFVFSKPHNGSHRALAAVTSVLTVAEVGSTQRIAIDWSHDAQLPR